MSASGDGAEIDRLANIAAAANVVDAVVARQGEFVRFVDRETRAYMAQAGDAWSDQASHEQVGVKWVVSG
jgi:hypothetical protein